MLTYIMEELHEYREGNGRNWPASFQLRFSELTHTIYAYMGLDDGVFHIDKLQREWLGSRGFVEEQLVDMENDLTLKLGGRVPATRRHPPVQFANPGMLLMLIGKERTP